ncbi:hypothetical protein C1645_822014, partial [Glomus cerebriforme]
GQDKLSYCYQYGIGINIDEKKAFEWYLKSAEGENPEGRLLLSAWNWSKYK